MTTAQGRASKYAALGGIIFLLAFALSASPSLAAFGISPPFVNANYLVPGAQYSQVIYLVQDQPDQDLNIKANLALQEPARSWISIDKGFSFVIPKGVKQFPVTVTVNVPKDTSLGAYNGSVSFVGAPAQAGQVTIALGVQVAINLTVGNNIYRSFSGPYVKILDIEEGWNPRVLVRFQNNGNVAESLDGAALEIYDQFNAVRLAYIQLSSGLPTISPFTTKEYTVEFPADLHLGQGQYWGTASFYQNNNTVASEKAPFNVLPPGSLSSPWSVILLNLKGYWVYYLIGLIIFLVIVRRFWIMSRRKKRTA